MYAMNIQCARKLQNYMLAAGLLYELELKALFTAYLKDRRVNVGLRAHRCHFVRMI